MYLGRGRAGDRVRDVRRRYRQYTVYIQHLQISINPGYLGSVVSTDSATELNNNTLQGQISSKVGVSKT